jgi:hypothetical protein
MDGRVGRLAMTVKARRRVGRDHVVQASAALRLLVSQRRDGEPERTEQNRNDH